MSETKFYEAKLCGTKFYETKDIEIGKLTKPHGLKGEIRMHYYGSDPSDLKAGMKLKAVKSNKEEVELEILRVRVTKNALILSFFGIDSIDDTAPIIQSSVHVKKTDLKSLEDDEYYWDDLIGMEVYDLSGELLGRVESIFETGSNDVYVIKKGKDELMIPAIAEVIKEVDTVNKVMRVDLLEGMRDDL